MIFGNIHKVALVLCLSLPFQLINAAEYFVNPSGSKKGDGSILSPFRTIDDAIKVLKSGDTCYLREGVYHEQIKLSNFGGNKPITFKPYADEKVVFSGSISLDNLDWQPYKDGIYKARLSTPISQLFVEGVSMSSARWPNGNWIDGSIWDKQKSMMWPQGGETGRYENDQLKDLDFSLADGGILIVNSGSFKTYTAIITGHTPSSNQFEYDPSTIQTHFTSNKSVKQHGYFLEGKKELIDVPGEWFYDRKEKMLYLYSPSGNSPEGLDIEGKVQTYFIEGQEARNLHFEGIDFFATTVYFKKSEGISFEDCEFSYPSFNKRMLGDISPVETTHISNGRNDRLDASFVNCYFAFGDGPALSMRGDGCRVENSTFHDFDFSCLNAGGYMFDLGATSNLHFRRNKAWNTGNSELLQVGSKAIVELNDLSRCGFLQNDGSLIQVSVGGQNGTFIRYNWVHNAVKQGIRFDNSNQPNSPWGENGTVHHNVSWNTERVFIKGDKHFVFNNLCFDNAKNDLIISANVKINGRNYETLTHNNLGQELSGDINKPATIIPIPGKVSHNWNGDEKKEDIRTQLRDPDNLDFRPKTGAEIIDAGIVLDTHSVDYIGEAPDIGAYEYGDDNYWIPGPKLEKASVAIPNDGQENTKHDADLMWLGAYEKDNYKVFFGEDPNNLELVSTQKNNIYTPDKLISGTTYYWRVDCLNNDKVSTGDIWSFRVE